MAGKRHSLRIGGLSKRYMLTTMLVMVLVVVVAVAAYSVSMASSIYLNMREGLYDKARTASDFFENYITRTYAEYYDSA